MSISLPVARWPFSSCAISAAVASRCVGTPSAALNRLRAPSTHTATRSVAEVFDLDPKQPASPEAIRNAFAGRRADGGVPQTEAGKVLPAEIR